MAFTPTQTSSGRWRSGYKLPGQPKVQRAGFDYAHEALDWAEQAEREAREGAPVAPVAAPVAGVTFAEHGADWASRQGHLSASSQDDYRRCVRVISASDLGQQVLATVQLRDIQRWRTQQVAEGVGAPTINRRLKVWRMVCKDAKAHGLMGTDPSVTERFLTPETRTDRTVTREEETILLAEAGSDDMRLMMLLALDAGLRWGEAAGLTAANVVGDYLMVSQVVVTKTRTVRRYTKGHKLGNRLRVVPLTPRLADELAPLVNAASDGDALLFTAEDGRPVGYRNWLRRGYKPVLRRAKLVKPQPRFHDLRHTFGSRLAAAGVPRSEIATLMGHADEETTARYIHSGEDGHRRALLLGALTSPAERKRARKAAKRGQRHLAAVG